MPIPTAIRAIEARSLDIALLAPFGISGGSLSTANNVLVKIELFDGTCGLGEGAPFPAFNGETQEGVLQTVERVKPRLLGANVQTWRQVVSLLQREGVRGCARCAIETALFDALTRQAGLPLWAWFGGASSTLTTDMTIATGSAHQAALEAAAITARGMHTIKIKVGAGSVALDVERVHQIASVAKGSRLLLDANGGFTADSALDLIEQLRSRGVELELFEQPVPGPDWKGLREVSERGHVAVAADESVIDAASALGLLQQRAVQVINIKLMKSGIAEALEIVSIARALDAKLMIGGMIESPLAMSVSACFAAGLGGFSYADLDTPLFLKDHPLQGGFALSGETIDVTPILKGHGVQLREAQR